MKKERLAFWAGLCIPCILFLVLLVKDIQPDGSLKATMYPGVRNARMYQPLPADRVEVERKRGIYKVIGDPLYFVLRLPDTAFESVKVTLTFKTEGKEVIQVGPETKEGSQVFDLKPLFIRQIEELNWPYQEEGGQYVYTRPGFQGERTITRSASLAAEPKLIYREEGDRPLVNQNTIKLGLRGSHEIFVYIKDEPLNAELSLSGKGSVEIRDERGLLVKKVDSIDGKITIKEEGLSEGVYTMQLKSEDSIIWRELNSSLQRVALKNRVHLAEGERALVTNAQSIAVQVKKQEYQQTVSLDDEVQGIEETHEWIRFSPEIYKETRELYIEKGGVEIVGPGYFAFGTNELFRPTPIAFNERIEIEELPIDTLFTTYKKEEGNSEWTTKSVEFTAKEWWEIGRPFVRFAVSSDIQEEATVIQSISVEFKKEPFNGIRDWIRALRERIPFGL